MINGKRKAVTFSYDDGVFQDKRLIKIFNEYGLKGTFNLNSGLFDHRHETIYNHITVLEEEVPEIYKGHELAVHGFKHPILADLSPEEIARQIDLDRENLSRLCGKEIVGMAYPYGPLNDYVINTVAEKTDIKYARIARSSHSFERQKNDLLMLKPTVHHNEEELFELGERFLNLESEADAVLYVWGHSYEFDFTDGWRRFEKFCKMISRKADIAYCTNRDIYVDND